MEDVNKEDVLQALTEFGVKSHDSPIPNLLERYLNFVASTGDTVFPWTIIKVLVRRKIEQVLCDFLLISSPDAVPASPNVDPFKYAMMREKILDSLEYFNQAPFTIQRLCEVIVDPKRYYKRIDKLMRAFEKNLLVTTTVDPRRLSSPNAHESGIVNGFDTNGHHVENQDHDEPMNEDIPDPAPAVEPMVVDCPIPLKPEDETGEDIDVEQPNDRVTNNQLEELPELPQTAESGSSQENLLQIQLQMQEQQEKEPVVPPVINESPKEEEKEKEEKEQQKEEPEKQQAHQEQQKETKKDDENRENEQPEAPTVEEQKREEQIQTTDDPKKTEKHSVEQHIAAEPIVADPVGGGDTPLTSTPTPPPEPEPIVELTETISDKKIEPEKPESKTLPESATSTPPIETSQPTQPTILS